MPSILDFLSYFDSLRGEPAAIIVLATAGFIFIMNSWKLALLAMIVQYLVAGFLFADVLLPHLAFTNVLMGLFISLMFYFTARQVNWGQLPEDVTEGEAIHFRTQRRVQLGTHSLPAAMPVRILLTAVIIVVVAAIYDRQLLSLPIAPDYFTLSTLGLVSLGLAGMSITSEPFKGGLGLLTFILGFQLYYSALEQSAAMLLILIIVNLILTLAISYLVQLKHAYKELVDDQFI